MTSKNEHHLRFPFSTTQGQHPAGGSVRSLLILLLILSGLLCPQVQASSEETAKALPRAPVEFFVSTQGSDGRDGLTKETAFQTVQKGLDALMPGDTLTILPGEYQESVLREDLGGESQTLIRAMWPGTVLLRGDIPAPQFEKNADYKFVYSAKIDQVPVTVLETDTLTDLQRQTDLPAVEFQPGSFHYDPETRLLSVSSSDLQPPAAHVYSISVTNKSGFLLVRPRNVVVDGLAATGFYPSEDKAHSFTQHVSGIMMIEPVECEIRRCTAYLNGNGICTVDGRGNVIEQCTAYGNFTSFHSPGGNIVCFNSDQETIRDSLAYGSPGVGIKFYARIKGPVALEGNTAWGNGGDDFWVKGGSPGFSMSVARAERNIGLGRWHVGKEFEDNVRNNLVGQDNTYYKEMSRDNVRLAGLDPDQEFADPENLDFRLQSESTLRGTGPEKADRGPFPFVKNIFYLSTDGSDEADGLSVTSAWKTLERALNALRPGDTLYLLEGEYLVPEAPIALRGNADAPIRLRGRGTDTVVLSGDAVFSGPSFVEIERLNFSGNVQIDGGTDAAFSQCRFAGSKFGIESHETKRLRIEHCEFSGFSQCGIALLAGTDAFLRGNLFDNPKAPAVQMPDSKSVVFSDYNAFRNADAAWEVGGHAIPLGSIPDGQEQHSFQANVSVAKQGGTFLVENADILAARGPLGKPIGIYPTRPVRPVRIAGPFLHSATDTTANLEWWTSLPATYEIAWGETPACENTLSIKATGFHSFSLGDLAPGKKVFFEIRNASPLNSPGYIQGLPTQFDSAPLAFTTSDEPPPQRTFYVKPDGMDSADGLSEKTAWRTANRAAEEVLAGDTVLFGEGEYSGTVWIRGTGSPENPVSWKAMPGHRVTFNGLQRQVPRAFIMSSKQDLRFDGFYFVNFGKNLGISSLEPTGIFVLNNCDRIEITRCFMDGRGRGYCPAFLRGQGSRDVLIKNCVVLGGFQGVHVYQFDRLVIENTVFLRNLIAAAIIVNRPGRIATLRNNIVTDSLPIKQTIQLFEIPHAASIEQENNCFFLRLPAEERKNVVWFYQSAGKLKLPEWFALKGGDNGSVVRNPRFAVMPEVPETAEPESFLPDSLVAIENLDFSDLIATDPDLRARGIGLDPEAFETSSSPASNEN